MKTQRSWHEFRGYRLLVAAILTAAIGAGCLRPAVAQDGESGVDDNAYTGPNYGWSVEWDDDVWEVAEESNEDESDYLVLKTLDGESPVAYTRFWGTDGVFDDPKECAADWEDRVASGEGNSDVEATDEYEAPRAVAPAPPMPTRLKMTMATPLTTSCTSSASTSKRTARS